MVNFGVDIRGSAGNSGNDGKGVVFHGANFRLIDVISEQELRLTIVS